MSILISIFTVVLILVSAFLVLIVLAQKAKSDGGVGGALGGGVAEATFGAETGNVLTGATIKASVAFFVLSFGLYLGHIYQHKRSLKEAGELPTITAPAAPAPTTPESALPTSLPSSPTPLPATTAPEAAAPAPAAGTGGQPTQP
jgi:preprotein translocase subunit SecG